jgi:hypothetical protein
LHPYLCCPSAGAGAVAAATSWEGNKQAKLFVGGCVSSLRTGEETPALVAHQHLLPIPQGFGFPGFGAEKVGKEGLGEETFNLVLRIVLGLFRV